MVVVEKELRNNVVEEAKNRIIRIFQSGLDIHLSTSGGKDSICLCNLVYELIQENKIDKDQLSVTFIDEEAMFEDVIDIVFEWRKKFLLLGVKFNYFCIETKHFNCLNSLERDLTFITWDRYKKDVWVREKPSFAISDHPLLEKRKDSYQAFLDKFSANGISMIGLRISESFQRRKAVAKTMSKTATLVKKKELIRNTCFYPIYDWGDNDVWKYIHDKKLNFPETYIQLYRIGLSRMGMRISQFFSIDTAKVLVHLSAYKPDLMNRVLKREPNAYLVALYWDSVMFRRGSVGKKSQQGQGEEDFDYKKEAITLMNFMLHSGEESKVKLAKAAKRPIVMQLGDLMTQRHWKQLYKVLVAGDPKQRSIRVFKSDVFKDYHSSY